MADWSQDVDNIVREEVEFQRKRAEVQRKLQLIQAYGEDVYPNGTVLQFGKAYKYDAMTMEGPRHYEYAALRTADLWYVTGERAPSGINWETLVLWLTKGIAVESTEITVMEYPGDG